MHRHGTVLQPLAVVTDKNEFSFIVYDSPYADTDYYHVAQKKTFKDYQIQITDGKDVRPLFQALVYLYDNWDVEGATIETLKKTSENFFLDVLNLYVLGGSNLGSYGMFVNLKKGFPFIVGITLKKHKEGAIESIEKHQDLNFFSKLASPKVTTAWTRLLGTRAIKNIALFFRPHPDDGPKVADRKRVVSSNLGGYVEFKLKKKKGWPQKSDLSEIVDIPANFILTDEEEIEVAPPRITTLVANRKAGTYLEGEKQTPKKVVRREQGDMKGMRTSGATYYTYSSTGADEDFTSKNMRRALEVYVRQGNFEKASYAVAELWGLRKLNSTEARKLFLTLASIAYRNIGPYDPDLVLTVLNLTNTWMPSVRPLSEDRLPQIISIVRSMCDSEKTRRPSYVDYEMSGSLDKNEAPELLEIYREQYVDEADFVEGFFVGEETERTQYLKVAIYSLFDKNEETFFWLDAYFEPEQVGIINRLRITKVNFYPRIIFDVVNKILGGDGVKIFEAAYRYNPSYHLFVYLCYMAIHRVPLGEVITLPKVEEVDLESLASGTYDFVLDEYLEVTRRKDHAFDDWKAGMEYKDVLITKRELKKYTEDPLAMIRDQM
jgi:hypothetical protein